MRATGAVRFIAAPDFENPGDDDDDNVYDITVTASDNTNETDHVVAITVTNENDNAPTFTSGTTADVAENQSADSVLYTAQATDEDGDALTYSLSGTDAARFTIDPATGAVRFIAAPDFENPGDDDDDNVYDITVTASDNTNETDHVVAITVTNENDNAPTFTSGTTADVAENQSADSVLYTAQATDEDGDPLTYSLSGTDAARFTIDPATGAVRFIAAPDFENPGDDDDDNVYDITVTASDNTNETDHIVAITVTNENDNAPTFTSGTTADVAENQSADSVLYTAQATDEDGDALTYGLSGTDAARFTIDPATGAVRFIAAPDFENPGDDDDDNVYDITVTASDGMNSADHAVAITVTNANDNTPSFNSPGSVSVAENETLAYTAQATDGDGDDLTYSLSGTDAARFTIDPATGAVRFIAAPDFENPGDDDDDNVYDITVTASDDDNSANHDVIITVTNENDNAPTFTSGTTADVAENQSADSVLYTAQATDEDGDALTYSLSGTDAARFTIDPATGAVRFIAAPDFENPGDDDDDNVYDITVTASDGMNSADHAVAITVTNANDNTPSFTSPGSVSVAENETLAYTAVATDGDGDDLTYSLSGTDAARFTIDPATGAVRFRVAPDFEDPGDTGGDNVYNITVTASDDDNSANHDVIITVTNENDNAPVFTSGATADVAENQSADSVLYTAQATDEDGDALSYSLSGTDAARFTIDPATGAVRFVAAPDFENPGDDDDDNVYDIIVTASDDTNETEHNVAITVTNENDNVPVFNSPATASVAENQSLAYTAQATDADGDPLSYSLSGTDATRFTIDADTGAVSFVTVPDFENPGNVNGDNVYVIIVTASDGATANDVDQPVTITVTDVNEVGNPPVFTSAPSVSAAENQSLAYTAVATDVDGDPLSYSLSGTDAALFTIDAATGVVSFITAPDFENPGNADGDNVYDITVTASDGGHNTNHAVAIRVTNVNDNAPAFTSEATASVAESQTTAYTAVAADADGDPLSYSLSGTDAALFTIDAATGVVSFVTAPDFEAPGDAGGDNVYNIIVTASDGTDGTTDTNQAVAIRVTDINDNAPIFSSAATAEVAENQTEAYTAIAADVDSDALSYSLSGTDAALFMIDPTTGAVSFIAPPDFENPVDDGNNNVYDIIVTASDGDNSTDHDVAITVTDVDDEISLALLDGTNGFTLTGVGLFDVSGYSVSSAGDVNGDGYDDLIIGAWGGDPNGSNSGETYVVYGGASAPGAGGVLALAALDGTNGFILNGIDSNDRSGYSVSSAGDVNGDGYDDLIIGAQRAAVDGRSRAGEIYVVYGEASVPGTGGVLELSALDGANGFTLNGIDSNDNSGRSVSSAGDVNGDGYDDLIIGAYEARPGGRANAGETYVVYGGASAPGTGGVLELSALDGANGFTLNGVDRFDRSGFSVSSAGDVNGDGYDDLIIGAGRADPNGARDAGETYVVYGGASTAGVLELSALDGTNGFTLQGIDPDDRSGASVSSAGDVNGDGYDDLIIGAYEAGSSTGETYVVYGGASAPGTDGVLDVSALDGNNGFTLAGINLDDNSGASVSSAGDVNGDGYDDLIIGAYGAGSSTGETYVVYGGTSAPGTDGVLNVSALDGTNGFALNGIDSNDHSGISVSSAGDVNGDGYDDLIIGAHFAAPSGPRSGETYVVYGGQTGTESTLSVTAEGTVSADNFTGNAGADRFTAIATGDVVRGAAGDDSISVTSLDFADIDGGTGQDTLVLAGSNLSLDLRGAGNGGVNSVEVFDLSSTGNNTLVLDVLAVFELTEERDGGMASLDVLGDATGTVDLRGGNFVFSSTETEDGTTYDVYRAGNAEVRVQDGVAVTYNAPVFTSVGQVSVAENQSVASVVYTAIAGDADGDTLTYSLSGPDADLFTIDAVTGELRFSAVPNFEAPADDGGDNVYDLTVTASDGDSGDGNRVDQAVVITVTDEDDTPVFTSSGEASVAENQSVQNVVYTAVAGNAEGDALTYSLSGPDAGLFTIDAVTGELRFSAVPNFEAPADAGGDNVYDLTVTASDGDGNRADQAVVITVTDEDDTPVFTSAGEASVAENQSVQSVVYTAVAGIAGGGALTYSLSGPDAGLFTINAVTGEVRFSAVPDFEAPADDGGDNVYDITVTASDGDSNNTDHAVAITVTDEYDLIPLSSLDGSNGFILNGIDTGDFSGISVSSAGDVNGDGYDDLIIGANSADPNEDSQAGETYIVYGGASAPGTDGLLDLSDLDGSNGFILAGIDEGDRSGISVSSAGDVNGDGHDDLIIGANRADPNGRTSAGEIYVVYGGANAPGTGGVLDLSDLDGNGFILAGSARNDQSGRSVASAGDVNGDGYDDLIIGADLADPNGNNYAGATYVIYGSANAPGTDGVLDLSDLNGSNGFILTGIEAYDFSGVSVSSAGDVNGDGYDDLVIGANSADPNGNSNAGETYVVYGGANAPGTGGVLDLSRLAMDGSGFILTGSARNDQSGRSVASAGDVNGDGYDDLVIGANRADPNGDSDAGETYIVYGGSSAPGTNGVLDLGALDGTNGFTLTGIDEGDRSGFSVSSAGDINGDGYDDLIIGAYFADPNGDNAGETYVVYGGASAPGTNGVLDLPALDGTNGFALTGTDAGDQSGRSVSSAGDVNGDGYDDLIIGAHMADPNEGMNAGEAYILYGGATRTESLVSITASGTAAADNFTGNAGADSFTAIATNDVVRGGAGDDSISVTALDFAAIDGGTGQDTLVLDGAGLSLDLTGAGHAGVDSVEVFDLSGTGANTLVLDAQAVFDLTEERAGGMATLDVLGEANDRVDLSGGNFTQNGTATEGGTIYNVYQDGNAELRIETGVQVQIQVTTTLPVFTSPATANARENQTAAYEAAAANADGDTLVYSLSGTDAALFTIDATTGEVSFITAPDFEVPGDADGDNVYDIIVTASDGSNSTNHNVAITVTDVNELVPLSSLDGTNGFILNGIDADDFSGFSVSSAGDVNGDGYDDLIIGAYGADPGSDSRAGEAYVIYGGASAPGTGGVLDLGALDGTNGFILNGIDAFDFSGWSVSSAGDVNGDGYDDLTIGARAAAPGGETYVVYGGASAPGTGGVLDLGALDGTNGFTLNGINANDRSGTSVSSAGDVNGDGYDDLIIGARYADPNGDGNAGETYIVYGGANAPGTGGVLGLSMLDGTNGFTLTGIDAFDFSGRSVSSAGDVNGDGYDDLIIGADAADPNGDNTAGETYIVYGGANAPGTGGVLDLSALDGTNGFILNGFDAYDRAGFSVSSAGDVNGDGYDDLIIGAYRADPNGSNSGETYVVYGGASAPGTGGVLDLSTLDGANGFILNGIDGNDRSGISVSSAGDINGDGYDDLIIGASRADPNGDSDAGETYIVYGGASAPGTGGVLDLSGLDGTNGFTLNGIDSGDRSGRSVSSAGDVNGDGYDDLIIGARGADPFSAGETYVIYGGATGTESLVPVTAQGTAAADNFTGNAGADSFTAIATNDVVRGGAGDDRISVTALDFAAIDGGTGQDTLLLDGAGLSLDLTGAGHAGVDSIEVFDLSGTGANTLVLDAQAVFDLTEERAGGTATLDVLGDADDRVDLSGGNFALSGTATEDGTTYNVYQDGNAELRVQNGVPVSLGTTSSGLLSEDPDSAAMPASLAPDLSRLDALMDNGLWNDQWDGLNSLDKPDRHRLNEEPMFEDLSVRDSIPDMQDTGEDAVVLMPLPVPALTPMAAPVFAGDKPLQNDLAMILQDMEVFADPANNGDTDMDGF